MAEQFDHGRLKRAGPVTPGDVASSTDLAYLIMDYVAHLKSMRAKEGDGRAYNREKRWMDVFISLVDNEVAWPIARQYVAEFRETSTPTNVPQDDNSSKESGNSNSNDKYMTYLIDRLRHRIIPPSLPNREDQLEKWQTDLQWRRLRDHIKFVAVLGGSMTKERQEELEEVLGIARTILNVEIEDGDDEQEAGVDVSKTEHESNSGTANALPTLKATKPSTLNFKLVKPASKRLGE